MTEPRTIGVPRRALSLATAACFGLAGTITLIAGQSANAAPPPGAVVAADGTETTHTGPGTDTGTGTDTHDSTHTGGGGGGGGGHTTGTETTTHGDGGHETTTRQW